MEANYILVRFGELTTKGKNRKLFTNRLLKNTKVYREPYEAAEGLELNTSHLGKILDHRINSGDLTINELDLKAVEDCAKLMEQIIKERLENNLSLF